MFCENELQLLVECFRKSRLSCAVINKDELPRELSRSGFEEYAGITSGYTERAVSLEAKTLYRSVDSFGLSHAYLALDNERVLLVGPFLTRATDERSILLIAQEVGISPLQHKNLREFYLSLPIVYDNTPLFCMLTTFCERLWDSPSFSIVDQKYTGDTKTVAIKAADEDADAMVNMRAMEKRYEFENELIQAVKNGQIHKETTLLSAFSAHNFEKRAQDPLRNMKNYYIIINTLMRKAAEQGGVHPMYIDRISSEFAHSIERMSTTADAQRLIGEMFRGYCELVRKHALKSYSPIIRQAIIYIDSDLARELSPGSVAKALNVSLGYLSTIFKREYGATLSDYIRTQRMKEAMRLLSDTDLQIQTIAQHCGILDVQHFSKCFKRHTCMSPTASRETAEKK